jgi:hypothetical protein
VQTLPSIVTTNGPGWSASDYGAGVCYVVVAYKADAPDAKTRSGPAAVRSSCRCVKGKRCYDRAQGFDRAGGSGAHRWATPSTWEWTDNLIDCRYNWARGVYAGDQVARPTCCWSAAASAKPSSRRPMSSRRPTSATNWSAAKSATGRRQRQRRAEYLDVEEGIRAACGGVIVTREGAVEIEPAQAKAPSFFFTDDDLISGSSVHYNEGILSEADEGWVNTVVALHRTDPALAGPCARRCAATRPTCSPTAARASRR